METGDLQAMPSQLELRPPVPTDESLRPIAAVAQRKAETAALAMATRTERNRRFLKPLGAREKGWLPYIKAAMLHTQRQEQQEKPACPERGQPSLQQGEATGAQLQGTIDVLPLHIREHLAVLERCTRNFSDALALVLSAQLPSQHADRAMQDKETGLSRRTAEDEQRHQADWADRHRLLSIFASMKEVADDQEAQQRAVEEHACRIIQRAWRSTAASRRRRPAGVHFPCTPDKVPPRGARSARLKCWLRGGSSTNTGFGRSFSDDRGPNLTRSRNSRASGSRMTSRRTTQADGTQLPVPLREAASTATLAAMALAANSSLLERHSGGFYKSLMATAGQASRAKRAAAEPPACTREEQAQAAGDKAAAEVLASGGGEEEARAARKAAMQRMIDAYHAGAAAAAAAAAEVAAAAAAAEVSSGAAMPYDPDAAYAAAMAKYFNARAPPPPLDANSPEVGSCQVGTAGPEGSKDGGVQQRGPDSEGQGVSLMPDIGQGGVAWADEDEGGTQANGGHACTGKSREECRGAAAASGVGDAEAKIGALRQSTSAPEGDAAVGRDVEGGARGNEGAEGTNKVKRTKSLRFCVEPSQLGPPSSEEPRRLQGSCQGSAAGSNSSRHPSVGDGDSGSVEEGRSTAVGSVSVAGGGGSHATSRGDASTCGSGTLGTNVSVWSLNPQQSKGSNRNRTGSQRQSGGSKAEGAEGDSAYRGSGPNSPRSLRSARCSKGSNSSSKGSRGGRGLLHYSGSSSDSDLASSHFSFKMREKLQSLDADRTPHADQDSAGGSGSSQRGGVRAAGHVQTGNTVAWAAGASPLGRPSSLSQAASPNLAADVQRVDSSGSAGHDSPAANKANTPLGSPASPFATSPFAAGAASVSCFSAALPLGAAERSHGSSMASAAAAAVAAVDAEHAAASASGSRGAASSTRRSRPGSSSGAVAQSSRLGNSTGMEEFPGLALEGDGYSIDDGVGNVGAYGRPRLRVYTGREAWGSGEVSPQGSVQEEQARLHAVSSATAAAALMHRGERCGGEEVQYGPGEVSPLPSPKLCSTPMPAKGFGVGPRPPFRGGDMSSYQIQRAYEIEASRSSFPEMLLRAHKQDASGGCSSSGSSSIRSPSSYAMANAIQAQIDALELRYAQQQQQQQPVHGGRAEGGSRLLQRASHSGGSDGSNGARRRSGSDTLVGLEGQQQARQQQMQRVHARRSSDVGVGVVEAVEVDAQLRAHAHVYARARSISYEEALEAVRARSRKGSHTGSRVCSRNASSTSKPQEDGGKQDLGQDESEGEEEKRLRMEAEQNAASAATASKSPAATEHGDARKPLNPSKRVSFMGEGSSEGLEVKRQCKSGNSGLYQYSSEELGGVTPQHTSWPTPPSGTSPPEALRGSAQRSQASGGRMSSLAASLDSALKEAAAAQLQHEQQQQLCGRHAFMPGSGGQPGPRGAGRRHVGGVAAQQNWHAHKQGLPPHPPLSPYSKPPTPPVYGGMIHSSPSQPQRPTLVWQDEPNYGSLPHRTTPPHSPPLPLRPSPPSHHKGLPISPDSPFPCPTSPLPTNSTVNASASVHMHAVLHQEVLGEPAPRIAHSPPVGDKRGLPLAVVDPVAASIEARKLAAARTRAWALEHAPNAVSGGHNEGHGSVDPAGCAAIANPDTHSCAVEDLEQPCGQKAGARGAGSAAGWCGAPGSATSPAAATAGSALLSASNPTTPSNTTYSPHTHPTAHASHPATKKAQPLHAHRVPAAALTGGQHSPSPLSQGSPPLAALAPRQIVWMGQDSPCDNTGLPPVTPPARRCLGGGLQGTFQQEQQQQQQLLQHQQQQQQQQLSQQQQQQQQQRQQQQQQRVQRLQQHQQQARARQQQLQPGTSAPIPVTGILPFSETLPALPDPPQTSPRTHAPPAQLDLECVGKQPQGYRSLSPMGQRNPLSPKSPQLTEGSVVDGSVAGERVSPADVPGERVSPADVPSVLTLSSPKEDCSSTSSSIRAGDGVQYLPPIEKGNAFARYLRAKREQQKGSRIP